MADRSDIVKCPLCHGQGQVSRTEILETFATPEKISAYIEEVRQVHPEFTERRVAPQQPRPGGKRKTDFEREVHTWNTKVSLWTRSNKE